MYRDNNDNNQTSKKIPNDKQADINYREIQQKLNENEIKHQL